MNNSNIALEISRLISDAKPFINNTPNKAYAILEKAYNLSLENNLKSEEGYCLINIALTHRSISNITDWISCAHKALDIFQDLDEKSGIISSLNLLGSAYFHANLYEDSLLYYLKCLDLCSLENFSYIYICVLNNIGEIYRTISQYPKALEYYNQGLIISERYYYPNIVSSILLNVGQVLLNTSDYTNALIKLELSYDISINLNDVILIGQVETILGDFYNKLNNYTKAMYYYTNALSHLKSVENKYYSIDLLIGMGSLNLDINTECALKYFDKAINLAIDLNIKPKLSKVYFLLSNHFEKISDYKNSLYYHKKYHEIQVNISSSIIANKLEILKIQCESTVDIEKIDHIKHLNRRLELEILSQNKKLEYIEKENINLKYKALKDSLTNIPNRYAINSHLNSIWDSSSNSNDYLVFFMIDIDNFKIYNDFWGHLKGDSCLETVAKCINDIQNTHDDFCGRYGGEEFVYIAKGLTYTEATDLGELIRESIFNLNIKYNSDLDGPNVTISVGGSYGTVEAFASTRNMIDMADYELYNCKNSGKNKVSVKNILI
ncbi:MAG: tetratricopeptide repeat-containing diguanylate cyclase [Clostridium sp.]|uniref:tetratricopeptide repeat-containing diguanylate cyclase n=1 Tax=Clostridium sp. TaxID=1506 RepID=UPI003059CED5